MRGTLKQKHALHFGNFLVVAVVLVAGDVFWGLSASRFSILMSIPAALSLITVLLLVVTRIRQDRTKRALLKKISQLGEMMAQERKDYMTHSGSHPRSGSLRNGQTKD